MLKVKLVKVLPLQFGFRFRNKKLLMSKTADILVIDDEQVIVDAVIKICCIG